MAGMPRGVTGRVCQDVHWSLIIMVDHHGRVAAVWRGSRLGGMENLTFCQLEGAFGQATRIQHMRNRTGLEASKTRFESSFVGPEKKKRGKTKSM